MSKRNLVFFVTALIFVGWLSFGSSSILAQAIPSVTYDELIKNKDKYVGDTVRVKAIWTYGFEWTFLCDEECKNRDDKAWVDMADEDELCDGSKSKLKRMGDQFNNRAYVTVIGTLTPAGTFGHMGQYRRSFRISCVERLKKLRTKQS